MITEQKRSKSTIMIKGLIALLVLSLKHFLDYDLPNEIVNVFSEVVLTGYSMYAIGNSPRIKGEY